MQPKFKVGDKVRLNKENVEAPYPIPMFDETLTITRFRFDNVFEQHIYFFADFPYAVEYDLQKVRICKLRRLRNGTKI